MQLRSLRAVPVLSALLCGLLLASPHASEQKTLPIPDIWSFEVPVPEHSVDVSSWVVLLDANGEIFVGYDGLVADPNSAKQPFFRVFSFTRQTLVLDLRGYGPIDVWLDSMDWNDPKSAYFLAPRIGERDTESMDPPLADGTYLERESSYESLTGASHEGYLYSYAHRVDGHGDVVSRPVFLWLDRNPGPPLFHAVTANEPTLYALGDGTYLMLPFDEDTVWFRVRTDLSSPGLNASQDHRILEQPDFAALVEEAGAVIRAMNAEARRLGHPRVSEWDVADAYLAVRLDRLFNSKNGANP